MPSEEQRREELKHDAEELAAAEAAFRTGYAAEDARQRAGGHSGQDGARLAPERSDLALPEEWEGLATHRSVNLAFEVLTPSMRRAIEVEDRRAVADAQAEEQETRSREQDAEIMREVQAHHFEDLTGYRPEQWEQARQLAAQGLAESGFDPNATVGTPQRPEILIDGASLTPSRGPAALADAAARRYEQGGITAQLQRHADGEAEWASGACLRQRRICLESATTRFGPPPPRREQRPVADDDPPPRREISRQGVPPEVPQMIRWLSHEEAARLTGDF